MKFILLTMCVLLMITGCGDSIDNNSGDTFSENYEWGGVDTIPINYSRNKISSSEIVDETKIIKLKTPSNIVVGQIDKLIVSDTSMFIMDELTSSVYCFNLLGDFNYVIDNYGGGPEEYLDISDISLNNSLGHIEILDRQGQKVVSYDANNGEFFGSKSFDFFASTFASLNKGKRVFHTSNYPNHQLFGDNDFAKTIYVVDNNNSIESKNFRFKDGLDKVRLVTKWNLFSGMNNRVVYYTPLYDNRVFEILEDEFRLRYLIDFGKYSFSDSFLKSFNGPPGAWAKLIIDKGYAFDLSNFIETERFITFRANVEGKPLFSMYDKITKVCVSYDLLIDDFGSFQIHPIASFKNYHVSVVRQSVFNKRVLFLSKSGFGKKNPERSSYLSGFMNEGGDDESPLLVLTKFRTIVEEN
jgi:hypothetical protein